ncbi:hypothetical protein D3C71_1718270 [compost metagenome]
MAVKRDVVSLDRHIGVERIGDLHAVRIANRGTHRVRNVDLLAKDAGVTHIAIQSRRVLVKRVQERVGPEIHEIIALALVRTGTTARSPERSVLAIMQQLPKALHFHRVGIEIPIQKIEVVRGLVDEQAA